MQRLSDSLKKMLAGLAFEDAGDYLSLQEKRKILGVDAGSNPNPIAKQIPADRPTARRIALISDGRNAQSSLNYAIDTSQRQQAEIDLLIPDESDQLAITSMQRRLEENDISYRRIILSEAPFDGIMDYIESQTNLLFLIASNSGPLAQQLLETMSLKHGRRMPVPLVMIQARPTETIQPLQQSAA